MSLKINFRVLLIFVLVLSFSFYFFTDMGMMGYQLESDSVKTVVGGSANPYGLFWGMVFILVYGLLQNRNIQFKTSGISSRRRRIAAFLIDGYFVSIPLVAMISFSAVAIEAWRTGKFEWWFVRDHTVVSDWIFLPMFLLAMALMLLYFAMPLIKGKPNTVGYYLLGLAVADDQGVIKRYPAFFAMKRSFFKIFGSLFSLFSLFKAKDPYSRFYHDKKMGTRVALCNLKDA
jgi:hypothetical protein